MLTDEQIMDLKGCGVNDGSLSFLLRFARVVEEAAIAAERERCIEIVERELDSNGQAQAIALAIRGCDAVDADLSRRDDAPDYRTAEQFYADAAHLRRRKELTGE